MKPSTGSDLEVKLDRSGRRSFFLRLLAAVGGGFAAGGMLQKVLASRAARSGNEQSISLNTHPLAVPRSKEGSQSHV
jgi:hypothetical protein